jgi:hypothetical protein|nr:MAG TPA: hypothetical protein [Caudoviricetes sp.]
MEIMNAIAQIAQVVGVPCVCLGAVMWYVNALDVRQREERKTWYEKHDQESAKWVAALNNNTSVITELLTIVKERKDLEELTVVKERNEVQL